METQQKKQKVLLVDDEDSVLWAGKYALDTWFDITTIESTKKALETLETEQFDIILLDIISKYEGEEAGINALKVINEKYPKTPVVMMSGSLYWVQKWEQLQQLGASGYLNKPFDREKVKEIIDKCLTGEKMKDVM